MKEKRTDFILDSNGDFPLEDFKQGGVYFPTQVADSDGQHIEDIIMNGFGSCKKNPQIGFNAISYINSEYTLNNALSSLNENLKKDDYYSKTGVISPVDGGGFNIDSGFIERK